MTTKLTLSLEESVIKEAKFVAKNKGKSLSNLIENYLRSLIEQKENKESEVAPTVKKLVGIIKPLDNNIDYKDVVAQEIFNKFQK